MFQKLKLLLSRRKLRRSELWTLCLTAALAVTVLTYLVAVFWQAAGGQDHASYAQNLAELFCVIGYSCLVYHVHSTGSAAHLSLLSLRLQLASNFLEIVGTLVHPDPYECFVPSDGFLGGALLFAALTFAQVALSTIALSQVHNWQLAFSKEGVQEMPTYQVCLMVLVVFVLSMVTKGDCGSMVGDAIWSAAYAMDDIVMVPQIWLVAKAEKVPWPLANLVLFITLSTLTELFADFAGMELKVFTASQFASNCFMYVWNDFLSLVITADFAYWHVYSLSRDFALEAVDLRV